MTTTSTGKSGPKVGGISLDKVETMLSVVDAGHVSILKVNHQRWLIKSGDSIRQQVAALRKENLAR
jgi:hypothetical protein